MIATYPVGGVVWDYGHYLLALEELGFEVFYVEDTGSPTYNPSSREYGANCEYNVKFLDQALSELLPVFHGRWHFRASDDVSYGLSEIEIARIATKAELFLNVSGGTVLRDAYMNNRCKILIDSDPGWNHFVNFPRWDAQPGWLGTHGYRGHDHFFTYAERIGADDCLLPSLGLPWRPTRPPVALDRWAAASCRGAWTTVMTWNNFRQPVEHEGRSFGTKEMEFPKIEALPKSCPAQRFELAVGGSDPPVDRWQQNGWAVVDSHEVSQTADEYREYIQASRGEVSVAKNLYSATRSGWFSCRSACYMAAGLPVVVQDTGFSHVLPVGAGLLSFDDLEGAMAAIDGVETDYDRHCQSARRIAEEFFSGTRVVGEILKAVDLL